MNFFRMDTNLYYHYDIIWAMVRGEMDDFGIIGDHPANIEQIPGVISVDAVASPGGLGKAVSERLDQLPYVLEEAKRRGKDVVGIASSHGREILIGVGVASLAIAIAATGAIIIHRHRKIE